MAENESPRVKAFRLAIAKQIPIFPNDTASRCDLENKSLPLLLIDYVNWRIRYIAPRPRVVVAESTALNNPRWLSLDTEIQALLKKVESGEDLMPYLSSRPHTRGYTPASSAPGPNVDRWADKDMLLNVMGYHHLHFDPFLRNQKRSDDMLLTHVTHDLFTVTGIFNHKVFEKTKPNAPMTSERMRLWQIFDERLTRGIAPGRVVVPPAIATSGHSLYFTMLSKRYARIIAEIDPKIDDPNFLADLYLKAGVPVPKRPKMIWHFELLTLGLLDKSARLFIIYCHGPN